MKLPLKATNGVLLTKGLCADNFFTTEEGYITAPYWLNENALDDKRPVLREEFLKLRDVTGIKFARKFLENFQHLEKLLQTDWFKPAYDAWVREIYLTLKQEALEKIEAISNEGSTQSFSAAKYIADLVSETNPAKKRGRPSSEEVQGELKKQARQLSKAEEDYNRLTSWEVIKGGKGSK